MLLLPSQVLCSQIEERGAVQVVEGRCAMFCITPPGDCVLNSLAFVKSILLLSSAVLQLY